MSRIDKTNYYLNMAQQVAERGTCLRRNFGAIIVRDDAVISTGYNGAPRGRSNCCDLGECRREALNIPRGQRYELCRSVHAEANCIITAPRIQMLGSTLYLACLDAKSGTLCGDVEPCSMCKRLIINSGISKVIVRNTATDFKTFIVSDWITNDESLSDNDGY